MIGASPAAAAGAASRAIWWTAIGERPAGKTAENWSRRDGIRAGAVSGPWRSAPRAEGAAADSPGRSRFRRADGRCGAVGGGCRSAVWIGFGIVVAAGVRAGGADAARRSAPRRRQRLRERASDPAPAASADPALASVGNVRLRVPEALAARRRAAIVAAVQGGGIADVQVETLPFAVETSRVGYYLEADRPAAEALARLVAPLVTPGAALPVRDYGKLLDDPQPGRLDLWVSD